MRKSVNPKDCTDAVSAVIAVMLMLVVTIIIAAVVSAFAGGLGSTQQKAPTATMEMHIVNTGMSTTSSIFWKVLSVSEPIPTKDVKMVTSWKAKDGSIGGATVMPWNGDETQYNTYFHGCPRSVSTLRSYQSPIGIGPGINWTTSWTNPYPDQGWGNYTLIPGVIFETWPVSIASSTYGYSGYGSPTHYIYTDGCCYIDGEDVDPVQAVLGKGWGALRDGDVVKIKFIHIPTGKTIVEKDVTVNGVTYL